MTAPRSRPFRQVSFVLAVGAAAAGCNESSGTVPAGTQPPGVAYPGISIFALWAAANPAPCGRRSFDSGAQRDSFWTDADEGKGARDFSFKVRPDQVTNGVLPLSIQADYDTVVSIIKLPLSLASPSEESKGKLARELIADKRMEAANTPITLDLMLGGDEGAIVVVDGASGEAQGTANVDVPCTIVDAGVADAGTSTIADAGEPDSGLPPSLSGQYDVRITVDADPDGHEANVLFLTIDVIGIGVMDGNIVVTGAPPWVPLAGAHDGVTGQFDATGAGELAGVQNVSVRLTGTLDASGLNGTLTVGGMGELQGGNPVTYNVSGTRR